MEYRENDKRFKYKTDEERRMAVIERCKRYRDANRELCIRRSIESQKRNPERVKRNRRAYYLRNKDEIAKRGVLKARRYYDENKEKVQSALKRYAETENGIAVLTKAKKKYKENNPLKTKAGSAIRYAVKTGKVIRPDRCSVCGTHGKVEAHHDDYSKPLEVVWSCKSCHERFHHNRLRS